MDWYRTRSTPRTEDIGETDGRCAVVCMPATKGYSFWLIESGRRLKNSAACAGGRCVFFRRQNASRSRLLLISVFIWRRVSYSLVTICCPAAAIGRRNAGGYTWRGPGTPRRGADLRLYFRGVDEVDYGRAVERYTRASLVSSRIV